MKRVILIPFVLFSLQTTTAGPAANVEALLRREMRERLGQLYSI